jgi:hypothetical protein
MIQLLQGKDFLKLGISNYRNCLYYANKIRKINGISHVGIHYTLVAKYFGISESEVLKRINS